jgi:hypothetical protein
MPNNFIGSLQDHAHPVYVYHTVGHSSGLGSMHSIC